MSRLPRILGAVVAFSILAPLANAQHPGSTDSPDAYFVVEPRSTNRSSFAF